VSTADAFFRRAATPIFRASRTARTFRAPHGAILNLHESIDMKRHLHLITFALAITGMGYSGLTRAEVTAEYIQDRDSVAALNGEDSGSMHLAQKHGAGAPTFLANRRNRNAPQ
jgi:hypothetical protein